ncbi:hypothetical protein P365_19765 [Comamonas thiooxydans]|nr:hypothetical protein P369_14065 [Comamonas thiooxydans]KGG97497.1 hypothetical protein P367_15550 [Comamonas thiooxydans]KGH01623.1 hypothetical protein P365_19765 [Comamonas thiooxydans]
MDFASDDRYGEIKQWLAEGTMPQAPFSMLHLDTMQKCTPWRTTNLPMIASSDVVVMLEHFKFSRVGV